MYPQLLPWKAKRANVNESTAKFVWNIAEIQSRLLFGTSDPQFINDRFDYLLAFIHHAGEIVKQSLQHFIGKDTTNRIFKL